MQFIRRINFIYILVIILSFLSFNVTQIKPKLEEIEQKEKRYYLNNISKRKNIKTKFNIDNNKVKIGEGFYIYDDSFWYWIIPVAFWKKSYLDLTFFENYLQIYHEGLKSVDKNNFAFGILNDKKVAYACMEKKFNFYYDFSRVNKPNNLDLKYWKNVFFTNIGDVLFNFKPKNYQCLIIITSNINFFERLDDEKNKLFISKFIF